MQVGYPYLVEYRRYCLIAIPKWKSLSELQLLLPFNRLGTTATSHESRANHHHQRQPSRSKT